MSVTNRIETLHQKHNEIAKEVESAYVHHVSDEELARLKKMKLRIKDEINYFEVSNQNAPQG